MDEGIINWCLQLISKELKKDEFKENVLKPLVKSLVSYIMPYLFFVMAINLFLIIFALSLVIYFIPKKNM
jgi:Ca2+-dependent lipid-binding protein